MKVGVISSTRLGVFCWQSYKVGNCVGCSRYKHCTFPDRGRDVTYDRLLDRENKLIKALKRARKHIKEYEQTGKTPNRRK